MPDYPELVRPAYIAFGDAGGGEFAFGCVTGYLYGADNANAVDFTWNGNDEMDPACGEGTAQLQPNGFLEGAIRFHCGDEVAFTARRWQISSTAC